MRAIFAGLTGLFFILLPAISKADNLTAISCQPEEGGTFFIVITPAKDGQTWLMNGQELNFSENSKGFRLVDVASSTMLIMDGSADVLSFKGLASGEAVEGRCADVSEGFLTALKLTNSTVRDLLAKKDEDLSQRAAVWMNKEISYDAEIAEQDRTIRLEQEKARSLENRLLETENMLSTAQSQLASKYNRASKPDLLMNENMLFERFIVSSRTLFISNDGSLTDVRRAYDKMYFYVLKHLGRDLQRSLPPLPQ